MGMLEKRRKAGSFLDPGKCWHAVTGGGSDQQNAEIVLDCLRDELAFAFMSYIREICLCFHILEWVQFNKNTP